MVRQQLAPAIAAPVLTAGGYISRRRKAQGLSVESVARLVFRNPVEVAAAAEALRNAEADRELLGDADLQRLSTVIRMVPAIYTSLVDGRAIEAICCRCGCSWNDACPGGCAWATVAEDLCTSCEDPRA